MPSDLDLSYEQAAVRAAEQSNAAYREQARGPLYQAYLKALLSCEVPFGTRVDIAIAIDASGRVAAVYVSAPPEAERIMKRPTSCLQRRAFRRAKLPPPPEAPFFYDLNTSRNLNW